MGNLKQRMIKAGRDFNYAEGVKVKASAAVYADQIVVVSGSEGVYLKVQPADAGNDESLKNIGRLMIAKHNIPADGYGVVLPWKLVTTLATSGHDVGDPIYLADSVSAAVAGNLTRTCPTSAKAIVVGRIAIVGAAGTGAILVHADAPEERVQGGTTSSGSTLISGCPVEQAMFTLGADGATVTVSFEYPIIVTDVTVICGGATDITDVKVYNGAVAGSDYLATISTNITDEKGVGRAETISDGKQAVAAETVISTVRTGGQVEDAIVITFIRG